MPYQCLHLARKGKIVSATCREILAEFDEKLQEKRGMTPFQAARTVTEILSFSKLVKITGTLQVVKDDPDDDMVLECAVASEATFIVSGDRHLLEMESYQGVFILRAQDLLKELGL